MPRNCRSRRARLKGRIVLITGAPGGAGPLLASRFAAAGAWIGVNFRRDLAGAKRVVDRIRSEGGRALPVPGDVADPAQAWATVERLDLEWGPVDLVVEQSGAEGRGGDEIWPPLFRPRAAQTIVLAALPGVSRSPIGQIILVGPAEPDFAESVRQIRNLVSGVAVRQIEVTPIRSKEDVADEILGH